MNTINDGCRQDQGFGENPATYRKLSGTEGHPGNDRACGYGTPIYSPVRGLVYALYTPEKPASDGYTGIYILCRTTLEVFEFSVGHVSSIVVSIGQMVEVGDLLGYEGNKGAVWQGGVRITLAMQAAGDRRGSHRHYQKRLVVPVKRRGKVRVLTNARGAYRDIAGNFYEWAFPRNGFNSCVDFGKPLFTENLTRGMSSYQVLLLQRALGLSQQTGFFGPATQAALLQFQRANGLDPVGTVGPRTRALLNSRYGQLSDGSGATGGEGVDNAELTDDASYNEDMKDTQFGALASSVDPTKLAATVTGMLKIVAGSLVYFGVASQIDADILLQNVTSLVSLGFAAWGCVEAIFGIVRKIVVAASVR